MCVREGEAGRGGVCASSAVVLVRGCVGAWGREGAFPWGCSCLTLGRGVASSWASVLAVCGRLVGAGAWAVRTPWPAFVRGAEGGERESYNGVRAWGCVRGGLVGRGAGRVGLEKGHCGRVVVGRFGLRGWVARGVAGEWCGGWWAWQWEGRIGREG